METKAYEFIKRKNLLYDPKKSSYENIHNMLDSMDEKEAEALIAEFNNYIKSPTSTNKPAWYDKTINKGVEELTKSEQAREGVLEKFYSGESGGVIPSALLGIGGTYTVPRSPDVFIPEVRKNIEGVKGAITGVGSDIARTMGGTPIVTPNVGIAGLPSQEDVVSGGIYHQLSQGDKDKGKEIAQGRTGGIETPAFDYPNSIRRVLELPKTLTPNKIYETTSTQNIARDPETGLVLPSSDPRFKGLAKGIDVRKFTVQSEQRKPQTQEDIMLERENNLYQTLANQQRFGIDATDTVNAIKNIQEAKSERVKQASQIRRWDAETTKLGKESDTLQAELDAFKSGKLTPTKKMELATKLAIANINSDNSSTDPKTGLPLSVDDYYDMMKTAGTGGAISYERYKALANANGITDEDKIKEAYKKDFGG